MARAIVLGGYAGISLEVLKANVQDAKVVEFVEEICCSFSAPASCIMVRATVLG